MLNTLLNAAVEKTVFEKAGTLAVWLTAGIAAALILAYFLVKKHRAQSLKTFGDISKGVAIGYSIGIMSVLMLLKLDEYFAAGYIDLTTFIPVVALLGLIIIFAVAALIVAAVKPEKLPAVIKTAVWLIGTALVALLAVKAIQMYGESEKEPSSELLLYIFTAVLVALVAVLTFAVCKKQECDKSKSIVYAAVSVAMSFALSYMSVHKLPQGGSVTFASLVPLMLYSFMFGGRKGVLAGFVYGFLQFVQGPWFYHPVQFLLDYPIAFAAIGLTGIFRETHIFKNKPFAQFALGGTLAVVIRYFSHVVSGIFVFGSPDPHYGAVAWSFLYNSFAFADFAIVLAVAAALFVSKVFMRSLNENTSIA